MLAALMPITSVSASIGKHQHTITLFETIYEGSFVGGTICVCVLTFTMTHIVLPFSFVELTVVVDHAAPPMYKSMFPLTFIEGSIQPNLATDSISTIQFTIPLTIINSTAKKETVRARLLILIANTFYFHDFIRTFSFINLTYLGVCEKVVINICDFIIVKVAGFPEIFANRICSVLSLNPNYLLNYMRKVFCY